MFFKFLLCLIQLAIHTFPQFIMKPSGAEIICFVTCFCFDIAFSITLGLLACTYFIISNGTIEWVNDWIIFWSAEVQLPLLVPIKKISTDHILWIIDNGLITYVLSPISACSDVVFSRLLTCLSIGISLS